MERFIQFNDEQIDSMLFMELSDLAKTLMREKEYELEFGVHSYLDIVEQKVFVRHFWNHRPENVMRNGFKSDVFLRAIGNFHYTDYDEVFLFLNKLKSIRLKSFAKQLFVLGEDLRIEEDCKRERAGTVKAFQSRRQTYWDYFESQQNVNVVKSVYTDALFNTIYLLLTAESPILEIPTLKEEIDLVFPFIQNQVMNFFDAKSTGDIVRFTLNIMDVLDEVLENDMLNEYFHLPVKMLEELEEKGWSFNDLKRKDPLQNNDRLEKKSTGEEEIFNEELGTWHRETSDLSKSFLQFDLDQGTGTDLLGEGVRESETGDQALGIVQGSARESNRNDYSKLEALEQERNIKGGGEWEYGDENRNALPIFLSPEVPKYDEIQAYDKLKSNISAYQKKLQKIIEKILEHKRSFPQTNMQYGRLSKKLLPYFIDNNPRMFYKKQEFSKEIDAVFTLLVDCSASMADKMSETKRGITLFHEALKSVHVVHEVVGFWEDTSEATKLKQPNYFKTVIDFSSSMKKKTGPEIMQLQPEEDNRDGYAIRHMTRKLMNRNEKQKFLLVFSDGEPAAFGYEQNGIVDTHEAVLEARKRGIEVINIFLSNIPVSEGQRNLLRNIYGNFSIILSDVSELPNVIFPLLRKLLLKSI
ncbi:MAG: vWA domain-containing protein [Heyndrickxia sp.]